MIRWPGTSLYDKKPQYGLHSGKTDATFGSQNRINQQSLMWPGAHWCSAFGQVWAAYVAGTIPVGAVVVDPHGVIAAEARNRIFDAGDPPRGQLAGSWLAHAELNAIAQIDAERSTTAEGWPCTRPGSRARCAPGPSLWPSAGASRWDMPVQTQSAAGCAC
jgi:hypothetical protein